MSMTSSTQRVPAPSLAETQSHDAFLALMWALSYPGSHFALPSDGSIEDSMLVVGRALLDLETSYHTPDRGLSAKLATTGAVAQSAQIADYVFFNQIAIADLAIIAQLKIGDFVYPDHSATVIMACEFGGPDGQPLYLSGPGILETRTIHLSGLPVGFWDVRQQLIRYPLGIDIMLVSQGWVIGLPRTTQVALCM